MISTFFKRFCPIHFRLPNAVLVLCAAIMAGALSAPLAHAQFTTRNNFVAADVSQGGYGLITIFYFDLNGNKQRLSFTDFSFFTIIVNGKYYSNNTNLSSGTDWSTGQQVNLIPLSNGATKKIKDTIETVWQPSGPNAFDIIQDVYPVAATNSGQIVYKWSVRNYQSVFLPAQAQFLLDVETGSSNNSTDDPKFTTREGYNESAGQDFWHNFTTLPPYFLTSEYDVCTKNFPGEIGAGYVVDDFAPVPMHLAQPSLMANVDLKQYISSYVWGYPQPLNNTPMSNDNAMLLEWPASGVDAGTPNSPAIQELGRGSYGTPPCGICFGNLDATMLHVEHVYWTPSGYVPNHFPVEAIIWNPNSSASGSLAVGNQTISNSISGLPGPVQIVSPTPVLNGGYSQSHGIRSGGSSQIDGILNSCNASYITWEDTLIQDKYLINCSTDSSYDITLSIPSAAGIPTPIFLNGPTSCVCPIIVDCQEKDITAPGHTAHIFSGSNHCGNPTTCKDSVYDNRSTDLGIQSVTYVISPNPNALNVVGTSITGGGCVPLLGPITVTQKDTLQESCVYFTFTDCASNVSFDTICFEPCLPPVPFDTLPPKFRLESKYNWNVPTDSSCGFRCTDWVVTDTVDYSASHGDQKDLGLDSITVISNTNMLFTLKTPVIKGMPRDSFTVCVNDSMQDGAIIIQAKDATGLNISFDTITYCTDPDTKHPIISIGSLSVGSRWPVIVSDTQAWDRGLKQVMLTSVTNCKPIDPTNTLKLTQVDDTTWLILPDTNCPRLIDFQVVITDSFTKACFTALATDCAENVTPLPTTTCTNPLFDTFCPHIDTVMIGKDTLSVTVSDITVDYDEGVDSVWFSCANNVTLDSAGTKWVAKNNTLHSLHGQPTGGDHPKFERVLHFTLYVTDTLSQDNNPPCVCINAVDGAGNALCLPGMLQWCSSLAQDVNPPKLISTPTCTTLDLVVTDSVKFDRGIHRIWLDSLTNFAPLNDSSRSGDPVIPLTLQVPEGDSSSYARLSALDVYGNESVVPNVKADHTTSSDIWIYKQDLAMNGTGIVNEQSSGASTTFSVPVYVTNTDAFPLSQKQISQFQFTFHLTGSPKVTFVGTKLPATLPGWTVTPIPGTVPAGPPYVISGQGPALTNGQAGATLVYLQFSAASTTDVEETRIVIDPEQCGADVIYNGGNDTTIASANYTLTLPAPSGRLNGGTIILKDSCTTIVGDHPNPTILSLAPMAPNPASAANGAAAIRVQYTVPTEAPVALDLYDALGRKVRALVAEVEQQGTYRLTLDARGLPDGTYFLRLASGGAVCSRRMLILKGQ